MVHDFQKENDDSVHREELLVAYVLLKSKLMKKIADRKLLAPDILLMSNCSSELWENKSYC